MLYHIVFNTRLNQLCYAFKTVSINRLETNQLTDCFPTTNLHDSMPISTCSGKKLLKMAKEFQNMPCISDLILHDSVEFIWIPKTKKHLFPKSIAITQAMENDLKVLKLYWSNFLSRHFMAIKSIT